MLHAPQALQRLLTHATVWSQLEGAEAQAHISSFALEELAAQAARRTALEAAFAAAGLGAPPSADGRCLPEHVFLGNADVSQMVQLLLRGPETVTNYNFDPDGWLAMHMKAIVAKGALWALRCSVLRRPLACRADALLLLSPHAGTQPWRNAPRLRIRR
jgi:hypothetical protein